MNNSLFNTTQETATRLTLCLPLLSRPSTIDEITAIDLIATYMKTFGFGQRNLHGDGPHALAEYDARRKRIQAGLAQLVIVGAATVDSTCLLYRATPECFQYSEALHGDYAASYRQAVQLLIKNDYETIMNRITKENNQFFRNPFDFKLSEVLENDTKEKVALTEEQEQSLLSFIKTDNVYHKYFDDVLILLKTGLRISELCGLTIMDVDFNHEVVIIDHQLLKSKEQGYYIETPKTKSGTRQVPLSEETIKAFQRLMKKRPKAEPFVIDGRGNFLFVNQKGKPKVAIDYNALFVRMVKKYNKHHKDNPLPHITPHTLRHTFCTRLASKNMNPKDLQYIMGHSNISITMNWYAHASIDTAKSEVQRLIA